MNTTPSIEGSIEEFTEPAPAAVRTATAPFTPGATATVAVPGQVVQIPERKIPGGSLVQTFAGKTVAAAKAAYLAVATVVGWGIAVIALAIAAIVLMRFAVIVEERINSYENTVTENALLRRQVITERAIAVYEADRPWWSRLNKWW